MSPLIRNVGIGVGGTAVAVAIYFGSIIGTNYQGAVLTHLANIIHGSNTSTVVSNNAPNWSNGIPLATPQIGTVATSSHPDAASGLASSTPYTFEVSALDGNGTTTVSAPATITTDASTTQPKPEDINITWSPVSGATGYAIYFGTTTSVGSSGLSQYFLATTSGQYTFSTSTGSLTGSYTKDDTTAFSELINPQGTDIFNGINSSATSSAAASTTALQVGGGAAFVAPATTTACEADTAGVIFFNLANGHEWGCNGSAWTKIF